MHVLIKKFQDKNILKALKINENNNKLVGNKLIRSNLCELFTSTNKIKKVYRPTVIIDKNGNKTI